MNIEERSSKRPVSVRPFLAKLAVSRIGGDEIPGEYCPNEQVWVVPTEDGRRPIVEAAKGLSEMTTKTKVDTESDDTEILLLEGTTKTAAQLETDDQTRWLAGLLETTTKTLTQVERDD